MNATLPTGWLPLAKAAAVLGWSRTKLHRANVAGEVPAWASMTVCGVAHYSALWCAGFKTPPVLGAQSQQQEAVCA